MRKSLGAKTLVFPTPVWVVGSYDKDERPNVMTAAWGGICCSKPPLVTVSLRKATYTYHNIVDKKAFTVNVPSQDHVKEADYFGLVSGKTEDKFEKAGLTPLRSDLVDAPLVAEFPLVLECGLERTVELGLHTQFIGEILDVKAKEEVLDEKGNPVMEKVRPVVFGPGVHAYHGIGRYLGPGFSIGKELK